MNSNQVKIKHFIEKHKNEKTSRLNRSNFSVVLHLKMYLFI